MYGGMGSYGGYGSMYGGMNGMGGLYGGGIGQGGMTGGDPNDPNSLTNSLGQSTQATFQIIESLVGAFNGVAQMMQSTYMATHSSFFGMSSHVELFPMANRTALQQWYLLQSNSLICVLHLAPFSASSLSYVGYGLSLPK